ncbi:hypothetical protein D3C79_927510 [compost metagenome]
MVSGSPPSGVKVQRPLMKWQNSCWTICRRQRPGVHSQMPVSTPSLRSTQVTEAIETGSPSGTATGLDSSRVTLSVFLNWVMLIPVSPVQGDRKISA